jgi:hypothetical protein
MTRAGRVVVVLVAMAATVGVFATGSEPALADGCGNFAGCSHNGGQTGGGYSAMAALVTATGGRGARSGDNTCTINEGSTPSNGPEPAPPPREVRGHYEVHPYPNGDGTYEVFYDCIEDGHNGIPEGTPFAWEVLQIYTSVPALDPVDLVEQALADMPVGTPRIITSPGEGIPSIVGFETWLMIDEGSFTRGSRTDTQGPISVTVWAEPDRNGEVIWDTGDGHETCIGSGRPEGSCSHTYNASSFGQPAIDENQRPAYAVTASVTYTGGYSVSAFGIPVGGDPNLGGITRTSEPYLLAVLDGEALNHGH